MSLRISVITAVFNRASTLEECLRSVQSQHWSEIEHIVIDGGSTDGSMDIVRRHRAHLGHVVSEPDRGVYDALNKGLAAARGDVVGFLHADDTYASAHSLAAVARAFEDPRIEAVYGDLVYVSKDDNSRIVRYWQAGAFQRQRLTQGWMPPHPTFYVRRSVYERLGGFDTRYRIAADYDNMLRLLWHGKLQTAYIPQVLVRMRTGGVSNNSLSNLLRKSREDYTVLRQTGIGGLQALLLKNVTKLPQFVARTALAR